MEKLSGKNVRARWYDPRKGTWTEIAVFANAGTRDYVPPSKGDTDDWVLVLEDAEKNFPTEPPK
jgi:hypothetical protein